MTRRQAPRRAAHPPPLPGAKLATRKSRFSPTLVLQLSVMPISSFT